MGHYFSKDSRLNRAQRNFWLSAYDNNIDQAKKILRKHPNDKIFIIDPHETFSMTIYKNHEAFVRLFIENGVAVDIKLSQDKTPLSLALWGKNYSIAEYLLSQGADIQSVEFEYMINDFQKATFILFNGYRPSPREFMQLLVLERFELAIISRLLQNNSCYHNLSLYTWAKDNKEKSMSNLMCMPVAKFVKQPEVIDIVKRYPQILKFPGNIYSPFLEEKSDDLDSKIQKLSNPIERIYRRKIQRKNNIYSIPKLCPHKKTSYHFIPIGNDPEILIPKNYCNAAEKMALIGTSGFRSIEIACQLAKRNHIPKIFILDNSQTVYNAWYNFRELMFCDKKSANQTLFENHFMENNQFEVNSWLKKLFEKYGYDYVRKIVRHTSLILQTWANPIVFQKIKNIIAYHKIEKIYLYPTNIIDYVGDHHANHLYLTDEQRQILENISSMDADLTILTDLQWRPDPIWGGAGRPKNVFYIKKREKFPEKIGMTYWLTKHKHLSGKTVAEKTDDLSEIPNTPLHCKPVA